MFERISSAAPLLARQACAYGEVLADDVQGALGAVGRRLWVGFTLAVAALLTLILASTWLIALNWDSPWRMWVIGGLTSFFALVSIVAYVALQSRETWPNGLLSQTRLELGKDRLLIESLISNKPRHTN